MVSIKTLIWWSDAVPKICVFLCGAIILGTKFKHTYSSERAQKLNQPLYVFISAERTRNLVRITYIILSPT